MDLLESIDSHHHRHTKVIGILNLLSHVTAAFLQQLKVLPSRTHTQKRGYVWLLICVYFFPSSKYTVAFFCVVFNTHERAHLHTGILQ